MDFNICSVLQVLSSGSDDSSEAESSDEDDDDDDEDDDNYDERDGSERGGLIDGGKGYRSTQISF